MFVLLLLLSTVLVVGAENVDITNYGYVYGTRDISTGTLSNWVTGQAYDTLPWDVELELPGRTLFYVSSLDYITDKTPFEQFYTYHFTYTLTTKENISSWLLASVKTSTYAGMAQYRQNPLDKGTEISSVFDFSSVFVKNTSTSNELKLDIIFSVTEQTDYCTILPQFLYSNSATTSITGMKLQLDNFTAVRDYDQEYYNAQSHILQQEIKDSITTGFGEVNGNLQDIEDILTTAPGIQENDTGLDGSVSELIGVEESIQDGLNQVISLPDGTQMQIDSNTLLNIRSWWSDYYKAPEYEAEVGLLYNRVFDVFMPYVGTIVFISLILSIGLGFLGRRYS